MTIFVENKEYYLATLIDEIESTIIYARKWVFCGYFFAYVACNASIEKVFFILKMFKLVSHTFGVF